MMVLGNTAKLLGLATLNIFVAVALAAAYLSEGRDSQLQALTEDNVNAFFREVSAITAGKRQDMNSYAVTMYFMDHVADSGKFKIKVHSSIPGIKDSSADMDKKAFVSDLLHDMREKGIHETLLTIQDISIGKDGRSATATTISHENVSLPLAANGREAVLTPASEISHCKHTIRLGNDHVIQMLNATCSREIALAESQ